MLSSLKDKDGTCLTKWNMAKRKKGQINSIQNKKKTFLQNQGRYNSLREFVGITL